MFYNEELISFNLLSKDLQFMCAYILNYWKKGVKGMVSL